MKFANTNRTDNGEGKPLCTCVFITVNSLTIISEKYDN